MFKFFRLHYLLLGVTFNLISNTTVEKEFQKLYNGGILNQKDAETLVMNAINHAFISPAEKEELKAKARLRMK